MNTKKTNRPRKEVITHVDLMDNMKENLTIQRTYSALTTDAELDQLVRDGKYTEALEAMKPWFKKQISRSYWLLQAKLKRPIYSDYAEIIDSILLENFTVSLQKWPISNVPHFRQYMNAKLTNLVADYAREIGLPKRYYQHLLIVPVEELHENMFARNETAVTDWLMSLNTKQADLLEKLKTVAIDNTLHQERISIDTLHRLYFRDMTQQAFRTAYRELKTSYIEIAC